MALQISQLPTPAAPLLAIGSVLVVLRVGAVDLEPIYLTIHIHVWYMTGILLTADRAYFIVL